MKRTKILDTIAAGLLGVSIVLVLLSSIGTYPSSRSEVISNRVERVTNKRVKMLDRFVQRAFGVPSNEWLSFKDLPEDMVIYRYVDDSLQSWCNRFPVTNDGLRASVYFDAITSPRSPERSPLASIGNELSFCNLGPKWYLVKAVDSLNVKIIAGLEMSDSNSGEIQSYSIQPLSYSEGREIHVGGEPKFKLICESPGVAVVVNFVLLYAALALFMQGLPEGAG